MAPGGICQGDVGAPHLQQGLDGHDREGIAEQAPEAGGPGNVVTPSSDVAAVQRDAGQPGIDQGARPVIVEAAVVHHRSRLIRERPRLVPIVSFDGDDPARRQHGAGAAASRSTSEVRATIPAREAGAWSFASDSWKAGFAD